MKNLKVFFFALLLLVTTATLRAQTTTPILGEPIVTEQPATGGGSPTTASDATVEAPVRGFLAQLIANGTVTISGPSVDGGTATAVITLGPYQGPGLGRMLTATFPIVEGTDNNVTLTFRLRRLGNGLDYTYSRVGRIKRDRTGI